MFVSLPPLALASLLVSAAGANSLHARNNVQDCSSHPAVNSKLASCSTASAFCSSYLGYCTSSPAPTVTRTTTLQDGSTTTKLVTVTASTIPGYGATSTTTTISTSVITAPTSTVTITSSAPCSAIHVDPPHLKRAAELQPGPSCGVRALSDAAVSAGCSCLVDQTVMATITECKTITKTTTVAPGVTTGVRTITITIGSTTTPVTTMTVTATPVCPTPDTTCGGKGMEWAYYRTTPDQICSSPDPLNPSCDVFDPAAFKSIAPLQNDVFGEVGVTSIDTTIYGHSLSFSNFSLDHRGYFFAPQTGAYTFTIQKNALDKVWLWLGPEAYQGWTAANADVYFSTANGGHFDQYHSNLTAGVYYPLRIFFAQGSTDPNFFTFGILSPDDTLLASTDLAPSPYLVPYGCNSTGAVRFPTWAHET